MNIEKMHAAVCGCGAISDVYLKNLSERFGIIDAAACCDRNRWKTEMKAEQYGIRAADFEELLNDPEIEMIINLTSPAGHYAISKAALEHGKHVFSEKMIALTPKEGLELCKTAAANNVRFGAAPDTFLGGSIQTAIGAIRKGLIGQPLSAVVSLSKDFETYGDILPHLNRKGGSLPYDSGCYYLTALAAMFGAVEKVSAFSSLHHGERRSVRPDKAWFGEEIRIEEDNILTGILQYRCGLLVSVHFNSEVRSKRNSILSVFGTEGILTIDDPDRFESPVFLQTFSGDRIRLPFSHGYISNARGLGAAEMAWAIRNGRPHRASQEMAYHVLEQIAALKESAETGQIRTLKSDFEIPAPLPAGYISDGPMSPNEESALI